MITQIRPRDLQDWLSRAAKVGTPVVLDVREPFEVQRASIRADGFTVLTIPMGVLPPRLAELDPSQPIACLCHHGGRSMQVAHFLHHRGFAHVANIAGGIDAWATELDSTVPRY